MGWGKIIVAFSASNARKAGEKGIRLKFYCHKAIVSQTGVRKAGFCLYMVGKDRPTLLPRRELY